MLRFLGIFAWFLTSLLGVQGDSARAQLRVENSASTYYGQSYLIPTGINPCHAASFNDHGQSIQLCIDNFGRPIPAHPDPRAPASLGKR